LLVIWLANALCALAVLLTKALIAGTTCSNTQVLAVVVTIEDLQVVLTPIVTRFTQRHLNGIFVITAASALVASILADEIVAACHKAFTARIVAACVQVLQQAWTR